MEKEKKDCKEEIKIKKWMLIIAGFFFFYNAMHFFNLEGSSLPILTFLYNMILYFAINLLKKFKKEII